MQHEPKLDAKVIHELINAAERRVGFTMTKVDYDFLTDAIAAFTERAIEKFVEGCKEHEEPDSTGFVSSVNHKQEMLKETIDLWFYQLADQRRK